MNPWSNPNMQSQRPHLNNSNQNPVMMNNDIKHEPNKPMMVSKPQMNSMNPMAMMDNKTEVKQETGGKDIKIEPVDSQSDAPSDSKKPRLDNGIKSEGIKTEVKGNKKN